MAVKPTGAIFQRLIYGDVDSSEYGIYITGEAVYDAPKRAVNMVTVPGRSGAIAIDQGGWDNIEISYPAGCFADNQREFAQAISNFRNAICSQIGYQRLMDTYNPDEFRMALYVSGLEVTPASMGRVGEFTITFNCKPQRWLTSGEIAVEVEDGDTVTNPTQYDASPLLMVEGNGTIGFNGYGISIADMTIGNVELLANKQTITQNPRTTPATITDAFSVAMMNNGDDITCSGFSVNFAITTIDSLTTIQNIYFYSGSNDFTLTSSGIGANKANVTITMNDIVYSSGTDVLGTKQCEVLVSVKDGGGTIGTMGLELAFSYDFSFDGAVASISETVQCASASEGVFSQGMYMRSGTFTGDSTLNLVGHPTYIDCDLGDAYKIENGEVIGLNAYIDLGSDLPTLASGENEVTLDNTITELKLVPRWWKL